MDVSLLDLQMDDTKSPTININTTPSTITPGSDPFTENFPAPSDLDLTWNLLELEEINSSGEASAVGSPGTMHIDAPPVTATTTTTTNNNNDRKDATAAMNANPNSTNSNNSNSNSNSSAAEKAKEKLAQRKLRNKESARRYREKQGARRRQLENFTRTLAEQNRELEALHDRLLALTCQRRMRTSQTQMAQQNMAYSQQPLPLQ